MKNFDVSQWYWIVGADTARAYSSAANDYVSAADPAFVAWQEDGTPPTIIDTEYNLGAVLGVYYPALRPIPPGILDGYIDKVAVAALGDEQFAILFNHENRLRNQEGLPPLNVGQAAATFRRHIRRASPPALAATVEGFQQFGEDTGPDD
jgi:hypothetical protein